MSLEDFLARLPEEEAATARVASHEIDRLARTGDGMEHLDLRYRRLLLLSGLAFVAGLLIFPTGFGISRWLAMPFLAMMPVVMMVHAWHVRPRTQADHQAQKLNEAHFLPHGGLYFAPGERAACVVLVDYKPPPPPEPEPSLAEAPRDPRKQRDRSGRHW